MQEIIEIINPMNFNWNILESLAVIFSVAYIVLAAKENIWCWMFAGLSVSLYIYICYNAQLYPETGLQIFYLIMAMFGYYTWKNSNKEKIKEWTEKTHIIIILIGSICTFFMGFYFTQYTDSAKPIIDSFTTIFSIIATYMVIKKVLEWT